jgi:ATP-binding cassette, subfamily B, bacterial PglK
MLRSIRLTVDLIGQEERWKLVLLFVLIVAMALVQTVGVASILPFMNLVADPGEVDQNPILRWLYDNLRFTDTRQFLIFVGVAVLAITAFSNTFSAVTNWIMIRFLWNQHYRLSVRLLGKYLHEPYTFYLDHNSATLAKNILSEVKEALNGFVLPLMKGLAQAVVALSIVALLVWVDVMLALMSVVVLGGAYGLLYAIVRKKQIRFGQERLMANEARFRAANEAFGGIKELMVLGREKELLKRFAVPARTFSKVNTSNAILNEVPRYVLETVAFGGILLIVIYVLATREDIGQAIGVMSLYALAGYRLMPALQQVFAGFAKARFFDAAVENLHAELAGSGPARDNSPRGGSDGGLGPETRHCLRQRVLPVSRQRPLLPPQRQSAHRAERDDRVGRRHGLGQDDVGRHPARLAAPRGGIGSRGRQAPHGSVAPRLASRHRVCATAHLSAR